MDVGWPDPGEVTFQNVADPGSRASINLLLTASYCLVSLYKHRRGPPVDNALQHALAEHLVSTSSIPGQVSSDGESHADPSSCVGRAPVAGVGVTAPRAWVVAFMPAGLCFLVVLLALPEPGIVFLVDPAGG